MVALNAPIDTQYDPTQDSGQLMGEGNPHSTPTGGNCNADTGPQWDRPYPDKRPLN